MSGNVVKFINVNELSITKPVLNKKKKLSSFLLIDREPFSLRLPTMCKAPFGAKQFTSNGEGNESYSLNVSAFPLDKRNKDMTNEWFDVLEQVDKMMIQFGLENSEIIFGKGKKYIKGQHDAVVEALYTPMVKKGDDKDGNPYPRRIQAKIRSKYDQPDRPNVQVYLNSQDDINNESYTFADLIELIPAGTFIDMICQPNIWFINGRFGITWNVRQIKVLQSKKSNSLNSYAFSDNESEDDNEDESEEEEQDEHEEEEQDEEVVVSSC